MRALIDRGEIGEVVSVTIVGAASLLHKATHDFDAMTDFVGDPQPYFAMGQVEPQTPNRKGEPIQDAKATATSGTATASASSLRGSPSRAHPLS